MRFFRIYLTLTGHRRESILLIHPNPSRRPLRRIRSLQKKLSAVDNELTALLADENAEREEKLDRRKFLVGHVVLEQAQQHPELIPGLRRQLDIGLTRVYDRSLFRLDCAGSLIPQEEWPGWAESAETATAARPHSHLPPAQRRARITYLQHRRKDIEQELEGAMEADAPQREETNAQRRILVGVVLLKLALDDREEMNKLRKMLDDGLSEQRGRKLFQTGRRWACSPRGAVASTAGH